MSSKFVSGERHCFSLLPECLEELPQGRRSGSLNRQGYEPHAGAAGYSFPNGECDSRIPMTVDRLPSKRAHSLRRFDSTGAGGICSPRMTQHPTLLTMEYGVRRASSEPPQLALSRSASMRANEYFGVTPDVGSGLRHLRRCLSPALQPLTHCEAATAAASLRDIDCVQTKRRFHGAPAQGSNSPRLAMKGTEELCIDIDARMMGGYCKGRGLANGGHTPSRASAGMSPRASPSRELENSDESPVRRGHGLIAWLEKTAEAENYAKLLGRPSAAARGDPREARGVALNRKQLQQRERGWQSVTAVQDQSLCNQSLDASSICSWSMLCSEPNSPLAGVTKRMMRAYSGSGISTAPSTEGSRPDSPRRVVVDKTLSKASRSIFASLEDSEIKRTALAMAEENSATSSVCGDEPPGDSVKVPLGLRRVVASMLPNTEGLTDDMVQELQAAIGASAQMIGKSQEPPLLQASSFSVSQLPSRRSIGRRVPKVTSL